MKIFNENDRVMIVATSNGISNTQKEMVDKLEDVLKNMGLIPIISQNLYAKKSISSGTALERASILMTAYKDNDIKAIFDISGGDIANEVLPYLDYDLISKTHKPYFGYSDLTTVLNSIYSISGNKGYLYQVRNMIYEYAEVQQREFYETFFADNNSLCKFKYEFVQGSKISGIVVGGNIRCLLKLAGTKYMPNFKGKILFLEARSGGVPQMITFLNQYKQLGILDDIGGIILGSFTQMQEQERSTSIVDILQEIINNSGIPIVKTNDIGHATNSKCIVIGEFINLEA